MVIKELKEKTERPKCDDCVSRADVLKYKCDCYDAQNHLLYAVPTGHIMRLPSVAPERKRGRWIDVNAGKWNTCYCLKCSECGEIDNRMYWYDNYCPNCGSYNGAI